MVHTERTTSKIDINASTRQKKKVKQVQPKTKPPDLFLLTFNSLPLFLPFPHPFPSSPTTPTMVSSIEDLEHYREEVRVSFLHPPTF